MSRYIATIDVEIHDSSDDAAEDQATEFAHSAGAPLGEAYVVDLQVELPTGEFKSVFE